MESLKRTCNYSGEMDREYKRAGIALRPKQVAATSRGGLPSPAMTWRDLGFCVPRRSSPSQEVALTEHAEDLVMPPPMHPTWSQFLTISQICQKWFLGFFFVCLCLILLVAFGSCMEEKGEISAWPHPLPSAVVWGEGNWGRKWGRWQWEAQTSGTWKLWKEGFRTESTEGQLGDLGHSGTRWQDLQSLGRRWHLLEHGAEKSTGRF